MTEDMRATTEEVREMVRMASRAWGMLRRMNWNATVARVWVLSESWSGGGRWMEGREMKEMGRLLLIWEMRLMYEMVVDVSEGMVVTRIVMEK